VRLSSCFAALSSLFAVETFEMGWICTDFGAILPFFPWRRDKLRQSLQETGVMGVARMELQLPTTANLYFCFANFLSLLREPFRVFCLRWPGSGFIKLARETLSKNAMLPRLTYFYCNWVSQARNVVRTPSDAPLVRAFLCPALQSAGSAYANHILQSSRARLPSPEPWFF